MECEHAHFHLGFHVSQMGRALSLMFILETGSVLCVCSILACKKDFCFYLLFSLMNRASHKATHFVELKDHGSR